MSAAQSTPGRPRHIDTPSIPESSRPIATDVTILDTRVRFVGDEVAAVAAESDTLAQRAVELSGGSSILLLPFETDAEKALEPEASHIHPGGNLWGGQPLVLERGNTGQGFKEADLILEETYTVASHSAAPLEPRAALARWDESGLTVWKTSRGVHQDRTLLSHALGLPLEKVRVIGPALGAGYGNKDESRCSVIAALLSIKSGSAGTLGVLPLPGVCRWASTAQRRHKACHRHKERRDYNCYLKQYRHEHRRLICPPARACFVERPKVPCTSTDVPTFGLRVILSTPTLRWPVPTEGWARPKVTSPWRALMDRATQTLDMDPVEFFA